MSAELDFGVLRGGEFVKRSLTVVEVSTTASVVMVSGSAASVRKYIFLGSKNVLSIAEEYKCGGITGDSVSYFQVARLKY